MVGALAGIGFGTLLLLAGAFVFAILEHFERVKRISDAVDRIEVRLMDKEDEDADAK